MTLMASIVAVMGAVNRRAVAWLDCPVHLILTVQYLVLRVIL
jgi:hypothetical protein